MISREEWKSLRGSQKNPDHIMLSIKGNPETSMTVTWRTDVCITDGYALCRKKGCDEWLSFPAEMGNFESDMDSSHIFWADMTGLAPDTEYEYTVGNDEYRSDIYSFSTIPENLEDFKFICVSDVQTIQTTTLSLKKRSESTLMFVLSLLQVTTQTADRQTSSGQVLLMDTRVLWSIFRL